MVVPHIPVLETEIFELYLERSNKHYQAFLGFSSTDFYSLLANKEQYLHQQELDLYQYFEQERRKKTFLQGRYIAKKVLSAYLHEENLKNIRIKSGVFDQPLVIYQTLDTPMISISHTSNSAVCLACSDEHPVGIDLEAISQNSKENIGSQLTFYEKNLNVALNEEENKFYTRIWSIKEALSKVLKTGLMTPFEIFQIASIHQDSSLGFTISTFTNFSQYKGISFLWKNNVCSIILPKETYIASILTNPL
jgi:phosphopantetheinyl transferase